MRDFSVKRTNSNHLITRTIVLALVVVVLFGAAFLVYANFKINKPLTFESREQVFNIEKGKSVRSVGEQLKDEGLISSAFVFRVYIVWKSFSDQVQAGSFKLDSNMNIKEIAEQLTRGRGLADEIAITFPEGVTLQQIAERLEQNGVVSVAEFIATAKAQNFSDFDFLYGVPGAASLEGYLFPDTYNFKKGEAATSVISKMLENFGRKFDGDFQKDLARKGKSLYEVLILASIVEKEVGRNVKKGTSLSDADKKQLQEERRLVAGVFENRMAIGMALESDATVTYITQSGNSRATFAELEVDSPYNTYKYRGLPPGPISSPSLDSIDAVIDPKESNYLFFLSSLDGTMYFAETLEGHKDNRAKYLE
ncbi:MAG: endolytic transglycosylase MltG [Candidatus Doudnabacteria bacterium CG10_big_fil_rev_8_21_14_0_10_41_10]|uniref:Endolytic murein transglycosylase n=1 Tax=Candidatus Doudnabacteria bacterium CG10_big_fil_rev_8_21_14_0_10_41_10 TaxID=1974551 RepID=A0A2H0VEP0_9BACT|nr:MAG: endolytic transglycosylase MltG [Candidatus Doudnabacteria bacterium CG10_big_fil_rev_8_21_14_0_10_41_10]